MITTITPPVNIGISFVVEVMLMHLQFKMQENVIHYFPGKQSASSGLENALIKIMFQIQNCN